MSLTDKEIRHIARLAAIALSEDELEQRRQEINQVLEYIDKLTAVDTRGVPATSHVHGVVNAFRDDVIRDSLSLDALQENAPDFVAGGYRVPKII